MREQADVDNVVVLEERTDADWRAGLARKGQQGTIVGDERNVILALRTAPQLSKLLRYDEFALAVEVARSPPWRGIDQGARWTDDDDTALMSYLQEHGIAVRGKNVVADCVALVAKDVRVHPVGEYLKSRDWDDAPRIDSWLRNYLGAQGDTDYLRAVGRSWLISAVARVMKPGCKADHVLVLEGGQGARKSMTAAALAIEAEWFADSIGDIRNKDAAIQLCGKWIVEFAELSSIRRAETEAVKAYLSRTHDVYRPPYGRRTVTVPRQCVFIGTTNEQEYLRDRTGNRRYWPVRCKAIDLNALVADRDQIWAEAVVAFQAGARWHLPPALEALAAAEQEDRVHHSELDAIVAEYLTRRANEGVTTISTREVFVYALGLDPGSDRYVEQTRKLGSDVARAIGACGWEHDRRVGREKRTTYRKREHVDKG